MTRLTDMSSRFRNALGALALAGAALAAPAHAVTSIPTLTTPGDTFSFSQSGLSGSFSQLFSFTVASPLGVVGSFSWLDMPLSTIAGFTVQLLPSSGPALSAATTTTSGPLSQSGLYSLLLGPGSYQVKVAGSDSTNGYFSGLMTAVTPSVPENSTWLMMFAGLSLIVVCTRRRSRGSDALAVRVGHGTPAGKR